MRGKAICKMVKNPVCKKLIGKSETEANERESKLPHSEFLKFD
jgi:hypothetical protein